MTVTEAIQYINNHTWSSSRLGLKRTEELLNALGNPQKELKFVHVAGTNGKGSTSAMIAKILEESGYRVGLYPSPYIETFNERIQVNGGLISDEDLARITEQVSHAADSMPDHPSQFEMITAIGMLYFKEKRCDIVVLEVGMGGRLDSTNVIDAPEACVITNIGYDHMEYLGDTLEKIAAEKAGIIKEGCDVIVYPNDESVMAVIKDKCRCCHASLHETVGLTEPVKAGAGWHCLNNAGKTVYDLNTEDLGSRDSNTANTGSRDGNTANTGSRDSNAANTGGWDGNTAGTCGRSVRYAALDGQFFKYRGEIYELSLLGAHQIKNAGVAIRTAEVLAEKGFHISREAIRRGLKSVRWPARFEVLGRDPLFILDGGHNPQCAEAFAQSINDYVPGGKAVLIIGMLRDKDYDQVLNIIKDNAYAYVCITPDSPRALPNTELAAEIRKVCGSSARPIVRTAGTIPEAIDMALSFGLPVAAFGSLYSAGEIRREYRKRIG